MRHVCQTRPTFSLNQFPLLLFKGGILDHPTLAEVRYSKSLRKITCLRYICSKITYFPDKVHKVDLIALYDLLLWTQNKASSDRTFNNKFGRSLEVLAKLVKSVRIDLKVGTESQARKLRKSIRPILEDFLIPERNYSTIQSKMSGNYHLVRSRQPGVENSKLPPEQYIGKGYRDKGTARNAAQDGSPSWQQIASSGRFQLEILRKKVNDKSIPLKERIELAGQVNELLERLGPRTLPRVGESTNSDQNEGLQS